MAFRFVLAAGAVAAALVSLPTVAQVPPSLEQKVRNLQSDLTAKRYEVARGQWHLFTIDDCRFAIASMGFCMGNNPAAPLIPTVPHWDNEFSDEHFKDLLGPAGDEWWTYRLGEREALVVMGPPPGAYFSVMTYAEFEPELIRARTDECRKRAQARGVRLGCKLKLTAHQRQEALNRRASGEPLIEIARTFGVSHSTISRLAEA